MREDFKNLIVGEAELSKARYERAFKSVDYSTRTEWVPEDPVSPVAEIARRFGVEWRIYWNRRLNKAGKLEMDFIARMPDTSPLLPDRSQVMEIFGAVCNHVECIPEFVCAGSGFRYGVFTLTPEETIVQTLLLGPRSKCGCDSWLDPRASREVYESLREWLEWLYKR